MPLPKIQDARNLSDGELADAILAAKRELFELRMQKATRRLEKPHQFKHVRHRIAQMMTVIRERELAAAKADAQKPTKAASAVADAPQTDAGEE
jgi:large subunit ribosomal protein L29